LKKAVVLFAILLVVIAVAATVGLWNIPRLSDSGDPTLRLRILNPRAHLSDKPDILVHLRNSSSVPLYVTTNLDPFVGGATMYRNYYLLVSGAHNTTQSTKLFLEPFFTIDDEQQMVHAGVVTLLLPGKTYSGRVPVDAWSDLADEPGEYRISAGYRGTVSGVASKYPMLDQHLESNSVRVVLLP
jgi:hypothetical protein